MAATNIAASHVSFTIQKQGRLDLPENQAGEHVRFVYGTLTINVGSGNTAVYTTAAKVPLTNLFDRTNASFLDLDKNNIWVNPGFRIGNGAINYQAEWDFANQRATIQVLGGNQSYTAAGATVSADETAGAYTIADSANGFPTLFAGQIILVNGFSVAGDNNVIARVGASPTASSIRIYPLNGGVIADEAATGLTISISPISHGADMISQLTEVADRTSFLVQTMSTKVQLIGRKMIL